MAPTKIWPETHKFGADKYAYDFHLLFPTITPSHLENLRKRSADAKTHAYCPYSNFRVGASLLTADGDFIEGANIENASYPVGICAERVAIGKAVFAMTYNATDVDEVDRYKKFIALAITTDADTPVSPCGMCRQFIREFCRLDMPILLFNKDGDFIVLSIEQDAVDVHHRGGSSSCIQYDSGHRISFPSNLDTLLNIDCLSRMTPTTVDANHNPQECKF